MDIEQIRVRIMSEAYDLADRGDLEGYNSVKVMCSDVLRLIDKPWVGLTDDEADELVARFARYELLRKVETKLKEKNT